MKSLILDQTSKNHPSYICYQDSNSFGDQILTLVYENKEGYIRRFHATFNEGTHVPFTKESIETLFRDQIIVK